MSYWDDCLSDLETKFPVVLVKFWQQGVNRLYPDITWSCCGLGQLCDAENIEECIIWADQELRLQIY